MRKVLALVATAAFSAACSAPAPTPAAPPAPTPAGNTAAAEALAHQAHEAYVTAINSQQPGHTAGHAHRGCRVHVRA